MDDGKLRIASIAVAVAICAAGVIAFLQSQRPSSNGPGLPAQIPALPSDTAGGAAPDNSSSDSSRPFSAQNTAASAPSPQALDELPGTMPPAEDDERARLQAEDARKEADRILDEAQRQQQQSDAEAADLRRQQDDLDRQRREQTDQGQ